MKRFNSILFFCFFLLHAPAQSLEKNVENRLKDFFANYQTSYADIGTCALERFSIDHQKKTLHIYHRKNQERRHTKKTKKQNKLYKKNTNQEYINKTNQKKMSKNTTEK